MTLLKWYCVFCLLVYISLVIKTIKTMLFIDSKYESRKKLSKKDIMQTILDFVLMFVKCFIPIFNLIILFAVLFITEEQLVKRSIEKIKESKNED